MYVLKIMYYSIFTLYSKSTLYVLKITPLVIYPSCLYSKLWTASWVLNVWDHGFSLIKHILEHFTCAFWKVIVFVNKRIVLKLSRFHILATIIPYSSVKCMLFFINNYCIQQDSFSFLNRKEQAWTSLTKSFGQKQEIMVKISLTFQLKNLLQLQEHSKQG